MYRIYKFISLMFFAIFIDAQKDGLHNRDIQLTSTVNNFMSMISGFTARMQCSLYTCGASAVTTPPSVTF